MNKCQKRVEFIIRSTVMDNRKVKINEFAVTVNISIGWIYRKSWVCKKYIPNGCRDGTKTSSRRFKELSGTFYLQFHSGVEAEVSWLVYSWWKLPEAPRNAIMSWQNHDAKIIIRKNMNAFAGKSVSRQT